MEFAVTLGALWLAGIFIFERLFSSTGKISADAAVCSLAAAIGASLVSLVGASGSIAQLFAAAAAATGGFLLWNWPKARYPFGLRALLSGGGALFALAVNLILLTDASRLAAAFLLLVFVAPNMARRIPVKEGSALAPVGIGIVAVAPVAIATTIAITIAGGSFEMPI